MASTATADKAAANALLSKDPTEWVTSKIPGGGMMYVYKRAKASNQLFCLGVGGLAAIYDCFKVDGLQRTPVAVKQVALDKRAADRFEQLHFRGLQTMAGRTHPSIVRFEKYFRGDNGDGKVLLSFVFERCPTAQAFLVDAELRGGYLLPIESRLAQGTTQGCDLTSNPLKAPPYSHREALYIVRQLLGAVGYLHGLAPPVIHRDVKPDNALIWGVDVRSLGPVGGVDSNVQRLPTAASISATIAAPGDDTPVASSAPAPREETLLGVKLTDYDTMRSYSEGDLTVGSGTRAFMAPEVDVETGRVPLSMAMGGMSLSGSSRNVVGAQSAAASGQQPQRESKAVGRYGPSVDVFSIGATYFFLVTGHAPSNDLRQPDWRRRFLGDVAYEPHGDDSAPPSPQGTVHGGGGGGGGGQPPAGSAAAFRMPSAGLARAAAQPARPLSVAAFGGAAPRPTLVPAESVMVQDAAPAPAVESVLDHFFPHHSRQRAFLKGLVFQKPAHHVQAGEAPLAEGVPSRWTAVEALEVMARWFPDVPTLDADGHPVLPAVAEARPPVASEASGSVA